jgi:hypothetical protein
MRHPKVSLAPELSRGRLALAIVGLAIFLLTFTPTPFHNNSLMHIIHFDPFRSVCAVTTCGEVKSAEITGRR